MHRLSNLQDVKNISVIGARGVGKSQVSRLLSLKLQWPALSSDILLRYENGGLSIAEMIQQVGWSGFREAEFIVLKKLRHLHPFVLDCGGGILFDCKNTQAEQENKALGTVSSFINREYYSSRKSKILSSISWVVFLDQDIDYLVQYAQDGEDRPSLFQKADASKIERKEACSLYRNVLEKRLAAYVKTADFIIDMRKHSIESACDLLIRQYEQYCKSLGYASTHEP